MRTAKRAAGILFLVVLGSRLPGQTDAQNPKFSIRSNLVSVPTRVQTKSGETIYGLKAEQFIVEDDGVRQSVRLDEAPEALGLSLVVAVQCSRYAASEFRKLTGLQSLIENIAGDAPHETALISFGNGPYVLGDFSSSPEALQRALTKLKPCPDYDVDALDTVYYAIEMLKRRQNDFRRAILLISETRDHGSRASAADVVAQLGLSNTVIYAVAFSPTRDEIANYLRFGHDEPGAPSFTPPSAAKTPPTEADSTSTATNASAKQEKPPIYLKHPPLFSWPAPLVSAVNGLKKNAASELASLSGGEYINFTTRKGFEDGLQRISNQIHNYYLLSFKPPFTPAFGFHTLRVTVPAYPDAVIQTRKSYWSGILEAAPADAKPNL